METTTETTFPKQSNSSIATQVRDQFGTAVYNAAWAWSKWDGTETTEEQKSMFHYYKVNKRVAMVLGRILRVSEVDIEARCHGEKSF
jgi:hypothetical protein